MAVDFGAEDGHDFDQVGAEGFHGWFVRGVLEDGDFDSEELADLEDDFAAEAEQAVFVGEEEFFDLALEQEQEEFAESALLVVEAAAQVGDGQVHGFAGVLLDERLLALEVFLLVVGGDSDVAHGEGGSLTLGHGVAPVVSVGALG